MGRLATPASADQISVAGMLRVGDRVQFAGEKQARLKVRARGERYLILTMPFNARHTSLYTVVDLELGVRGTDNYGGLGYENAEEIADSMARFDSGDAEISRRNNVTLDIRKVVVS